MRTLSAIVTASLIALGFSAATAMPSPAQTSKGAIVGFAFVSSQVSSMGSRAKLQDGTKIYPSGSTLRGTEGCPTNRYHTDGIPVVVIDYAGRPTAGNVQGTRHPCDRRQFCRRSLLHGHRSRRIVQQARCLSTALTTWFSSGTTPEANPR